MVRGMWLAAAVAVTLATAAGAQVKTIDPNAAIDSDVSGPPRSTAVDRAAPAEQAAPDQSASADQAAPDQSAPAPERYYTPPSARPAQPASAQEARAEETTDAAATYHRDDLIAAGEGVFGKGAAGLAGIIEKILKEQGEPNAYIAGREASGAVVVGLRYGSGLMNHKIEGQMPVYWTGPSVGFDLGGDANKVFVLVYNLYDTADLYHRFPAGEGHLYFVGGFSASYLRRGNIVLIPVRLGGGWRAGVNVGYMKFSRKTKWVPF